MEHELRKKRLSHFLNLVTIASADGTIDEDEKAILYSSAQKMGISMDEIKYVMSNPKGVELYVPKSLVEKLNQLYDIVFVILADGYIDKNELVTSKIIAMQYDLEPEIIDDLLTKLIKKIQTGSNNDVVSELMNELGYPTGNVTNDTLFEKLMFISTDHIRYQNGNDVSGHNYNCNRGVKIEPNKEEKVGYIVSIYNMDGNHPVWGDNLQMAPKQMKIETQNEDKIVLRGFGTDSMGASFSDYGMTVYLKNKQIEKAVLHMYDRGVDIEYLK